MHREIKPSTFLIAPVRQYGDMATRPARLPAALIVVQHLGVRLGNEDVRVSVTHGDQHGHAAAPVLQQVRVSTPSPRVPCLRESTERRRQRCGGSSWSH